MELPAEFHALFLGFEKGKGVYVTKGKSASGKIQGDARTITEAATVADWKLHLEGRQGLGIVPIRQDDTCRFAALDIDDYTLDLKEIEERTRAFPFVMTRSKSGGVHLWLFFSEPVEATLVHQRLTEWSSILGFAGCEVFPKQIKRSSDKDIGNWINMPYFAGDKTTRYGIRDGKRMSIEEFLALAKKHSITSKQLEDIKVIDGDMFKDGPPCLQVLTQNGFPEGTRNQSLYNVAVYFKKKVPDTYEEEIATFNQHHMDPPLTLAEVNNVIKSVNKKDYSYKCKEPPIVSHCNRRMCMRRKFGVGNGGAGDGNIVELSQLTKIDSDPPTWIVDMEGERVECETPELLSQRRFQTLCMERINRCPTPTNQTRWANIINDLLTKVDIIPAPEDASAYGQFILLLEEFCRKSPAKVKEELDINKRWTEGGKTYFKSTQLLSFLEAHRFRHGGAHKIWSMLRKFGAEKRQFSISGKTVQTWGVASFEEPETEEVSGAETRVF